MVAFINAFTGTQMLVADERVEEYKAVGHKLAASPSAVITPAEEPEKEVKKAVKKTATKKK